MIESFRLGDVVKALVVSPSPSRLLCPALMLPRLRRLRAPLVDGGLRSRWETPGATTCRRRGTTSASSLETRKRVRPHIHSRSPLSLSIYLARPAMKTDLLAISLRCAAQAGLVARSVPPLSTLLALVWPAAAAREVICPDPLQPALLSLPLARRDGLFRHWQARTQKGALPFSHT